jgi:hypothetical protein
MFLERYQEFLLAFNFWNIAMLIAITILNITIFFLKSRGVRLRTGGGGRRPASLD